MATEVKRIYPISVGSYEAETTFYYRTGTNTWASRWSHDGQSARFDLSGIDKANIASINIKGLVRLWDEFENTTVRAKCTTPSKNFKVSSVGNTQTISMNLGQSGTTPVNLSISSPTSWGGSVSVECSNTEINFSDSLGSSYESTIVARFFGELNGIYAEVTINLPNPTVTNLTTQGEFWEKPINVNWRSTNQVGYEYECYYNNIKIKSGEGGTETTFTIPANTYRGTLPATVRLRPYNLLSDGSKNYGEWVEKSITLKDVEATISDLIINGLLWEEPIELSWQSQNQEQFRIEVWKNNVKVKEYAGTTATRYTIAANQLTVGEYLIKVYVGYSNRFVNNQSKNVTLKNIEPSVDNLSLSGSNIDYDLLLSWTSEYQSKAVVEIYTGNTLVKTINLSTQKSYQIENNTFTTGAYTFKIKVAYTSAGGDRWSEYKQLNTTLVESLPSIGALQPDGIILDKNSSIKAWWTSNNQTKYTLEIVGSGYKYNGNIEKEHTIPMGTLQVGTHILRLTVTFITAQNVEKSISKESKFIVTGKPNTPTITSGNTYSYNRPVITWDSAEQLGFICTIEDINGKEIWSSQWQNGLITRVKCMRYLPNGAYKTKVKIMNEFTNESDFAIKEFTISVAENIEIDVQVEDVEFGKKLTWSNHDAYYTSFYIIRNGSIINKTDNLEYRDYSCKHGENIYTIRGVTKNDTYKDSIPIISDHKLPYSTLATVDGMSDCISCSLQINKFESTNNHTINTKIIYLSGREYPIVIYGEHVTDEYTITFESTDFNKFIAMCGRRNTFIHRDRLGNVRFLSLSSIKLKIENSVTGTYSTTGLKVDYKEVVEYD